MKALKQTDKIKQISEIDINGKPIIFNLLSGGFNFPDLCFDFIIDCTEHYCKVSFLNYQKTNCSILYHFDINDIRLQKGNGGVNCNVLDLYANMINTGYLVMIDDNVGHGIHEDYECPY